MRRIVHLLTASAGLLIACGGAEGRAPEVTWHADIHPAMQQHCTRCHTEGGQAVGDFDDIAQVRAFAEVALARMQAGVMPPPVADPECRDYHGSEYLSLPPDKIDLFQSWLQAGMPEGDPADAVPVDPVAIELHEPDLVVTMPVPYTPTFQDPQNPGNEYRCFILEHDQSEPFFITAFHPVIGEPALVHHVVLFAMDERHLPQDYDPAVGVDCINGRNGMVASLDAMLTGWAPGMTPVSLDETQADGSVATRGIRVGSNQRLVVQMHYYRNGPAVDGLADQSGYAFKIAPSVDVPLRMVPIGLYDFRIPPDDPAYSHSDSFELPAGISGRVHAVFPHMHVLGSAYRIWRERDGESACIAAGRYNFNNQLSYVFKEPIELGSGDSVHLECTWNNSRSNPDRIFDEPREVRFGERTDEEMCYAFSLISIGR